MHVYRVSRSQMAAALWRRSNHVDKQEMDALLDVAITASDTQSTSKSPAKPATTRGSRKRARDEDSKAVEQGV